MEELSVVLHKSLERLQMITDCHLEVASASFMCHSLSRVNSSLGKESKIFLLLKSHFWLLFVLGKHKS